MSPKARLSAVVALAALWLVLLGGAASAQPVDPLRSAVEDLRTLDGEGPWVAGLVALTVTTPGLVVGGATLWSGAQQRAGADDRLATASALVLVGSSAGRLVQGWTWLHERSASAASADRLLADDAALRGAGLEFLRERAERSRTARLTDGALTLLQGLSRVGLGASYLIEDDSQPRGYALLSLGVLGLGGGVLHFFTEAPPELLLERAQQAASPAVTWAIIPQANPGPLGGVEVGLGVVGAF